MRKYHLTVLGVLISAAALAACSEPAGNGVDDVGVDPVEESTPQPAASTPTPVETAGNPGVPPGAAPVTDTTLMVASEGASQPYLADNAGSALYTLEGSDEPGACTDACQEAWPPLLVVGDAMPTVGPQLQAGMAGTVPREDGAVQVTYNGHPLYRYAADTGAGRVAGHDVQDQWGEWYLVGPDGELLPDGAATPEETTDPGETAEPAEAAEQ